jgi:hypothetical protein
MVEVGTSIPEGGPALTFSEAFVPASVHLVLEMVSLALGHQVLEISGVDLVENEVREVLLDQIDLEVPYGS